MGTLTGANLISRIQDTLQDTTGVRWTEAELLRYINDAQRVSLYEFIERNVDNCLVTNYNIIDFLERKSPYCFGGYFYVTEEKFLSPIYMMAQQGIDKVIKFRKVKNGSNKKTA